jgi:hypothetical protein
MALPRERSNQKIAMKLKILSMARFTKSQKTIPKKEVDPEKDVG